MVTFTSHTKGCDLMSVSTHLLKRRAILLSSLGVPGLEFAPEVPRVFFASVYQTVHPLQAEQNGIFVHMTLRVLIFGLYSQMWPHLIMMSDIISFTVIAE